MLFWLTIITFLGLVVVGIWYDRIIPPIRKALAGRRPQTTGRASEAAVVIDSARLEKSDAEAPPVNRELAEIQLHLDQLTSGKVSNLKNLILSQRGDDLARNT